MRCVQQVGHRRRSLNCGQVLLAIVVRSQRDKVFYNGLAAILHERPMDVGLVDFGNRSLLSNVLGRLGFFEVTGDLGSVRVCCPRFSFRLVRLRL